RWAGATRGSAEGGAYLEVQAGTAAPGRGHDTSSVEGPQKGGPLYNLKSCIPTRRVHYAFTDESKLTFETCRRPGSIGWTGDCPKAEGQRLGRPAPQPGSRTAAQPTGFSAIVAAQEANEFDMQ